MEKELQEKIKEWLKIQVFDDELVRILMDDDNIESTMNIYKKRQEGWKKKL